MTQRKMMQKPTDEKTADRAESMTGIAPAETNTGATQGGRELDGRVFKVRRLEHAIVSVPALALSKTADDAATKACECPDALLNREEEWVDVTYVELDPETPIEDVTDHPEYAEEIAAIRKEQASQNKSRDKGEVR